MRFLLDECLPQSSKEVFKLLNFDVINSRDANLIGCEDYKYVIYSNKTNRMLVTLDKDFSNTLIYKIGNNPGIIILRPKYPITTFKVNRLIYKFLKSIHKLEIKKSLVIVSSNKIRIKTK